MKFKIFLSVNLFLFVFFSLELTAQTFNPGSVELPNGWSLSPAGSAIHLSSDLPLNIAVSPSKKYAAITDNGDGVEGIELIDVAGKKLLSFTKMKAAWVGLQFSNDNKYLYASAANQNRIVRFKVENNDLLPVDSIVLGKPWPNKIGITGIALDDHKSKIYAVTKENNSLYVCETKSGKTLQQIPLSAEAYTCLLNPQKTILYISLWGGDKVLLYDVKKGMITDSIGTESHPNDMVLSKKGDYLFVANANSNSVSVINTQKRKVIETLSASLYPDAPTGSTSNGVCLSGDGKTLYIANADNNCLAVFNVSKPGSSRSLGFIPTGWYPTSVKLVGNTLLVTNGKGFESMANPYGPQPDNKKIKSSYQKEVTSEEKQQVQYIGNLFKGSLSFISVPSPEELENYSTQVYKNTPYNKNKEALAAGETGNPIPQRVGAPSPIKYIFYVIKENRTYDQVLGDMKEGNGDSSLCLFPERITPNLHALARDFVLLDNFYDDAEVSADGHNWSTAAYATDYVEKTWPANYSGRGGTYDYEGTRKIAYPAKGFIWDYCNRAGISYRNYGEFVHDGQPPILPSIVGHFCAGFPDFDLSIQDVYREKVWEHDFDSLIAANALPTFSTLRFPNDHTSGMRKGAYTPYAAAADNDLAVGRFIEHISQSPIWKESAIFIVEDDAQNGPDHVDAHRSTAYVISPYVKRNFVDHTMYSTSGLLRTIELILGLPPMSQYDAAAMPMFRSFTATPDLTPYASKPANINIDERNTAWNKLARESAKFNLAIEDAAPDIPFNEVIWKSIKGENSVMPTPRHSAFLKVQEKDDDD
ncbi:MAG TPA: bifunctional YncE family protein/alkaline phosphatase family protein [Hanamia sp.]|nr:bifunctional YncE family protein/alkaline phosphatase family protein [Hanamia sp.]